MRSLTHSLSPEDAPSHRSPMWSAAAIVAMLVAGATLVVSRRPDAVTNPQFWAEDGKFWFADAYNLGIGALFKSDEGYLLTLPRLVAAPVSGLTLSQAALVFNLVGLTAQVAPAALFISRRFERVAPRVWVRAVVGLAYLLIPSFELNVTLTNAQWHLALLAVMVLVAQPPQSAAARVFDVAVLMLSGLTGPFAVVLLPAAAARCVTTTSHRHWYGTLSGMLLVTLLLQGVAVLMGHRDPVAPLGISFRNAVTIVADRVVLPGTFAEEGHGHLHTAGSTAGVVIAALITVAALGVIGFALLRGGSQLRIFLLTCLALTGLCLLAPIATPPGMTAWTSLATSDGGERYFLIAELAWFVCVSWAISRVPRWRLRSAASVGLVAAFASGLVNSWSYAPYTDFHPDAYTAELLRATPGTKVVVPLNPGWQMTLIRH